ncbi:MAG: flippase-like domain-containing protein [Polyangiaceae bacterium]|nr:flippase-like domain-containing protein [Polyangiaceae bacterium]
MQAKKPTLLRWILRLLGPLSLVWVIYKLDKPAKVLDLLGGANYGLIAIAVLLNLVNIELKVERWRMLLRERGIEYEWRRATVAFLSSSYAGFVTPGRVGDVLRAEYLRREKGVHWHEGVLSVVVDRVCDLAALGLCVALSLLHLRNVVSDEIAKLGWVLVGLTLVGTVVFVVLSLRKKGGEVTEQTPQFSIRSIIQKLQSYHPKALALPMGLTLVTFGVTFLQGYLLARAIGTPMSFLDVSALLAAASFLGLLPISISGMGIREALFAVVFPQRGFPADAGVALGILVFFVIYGGVALFGLLAWVVWPPQVASEGRA